MADRPAVRQDHGPERLAAWSAIGGLLTTLVVVAVSGRLALGQRASGDTEFGAIGFSVAFAAPFVAALASFFVRDRDVRRAVWAACGLVALILGGLTIFSGVGWLFGAAGLGLLSAWWQTRERDGDLASARGVALAVWMLVWFVGALAALWLHETPVCWDASANGSGRSEKSVTTICSSDIADDVEGVLALAGVAIGFGGMAFNKRAGSYYSREIWSKRRRAEVTHAPDQATNRGIDCDRHSLRGGHDSRGASD